VGEPYGDNQNIQVFANTATAYGEAQLRHLTMTGVASNVVSGDQPAIGFMDQDADGYGGAAVGCGFEGSIVTNSLDCDDTNAAVNPGVLDLCNGVDDDCNGLIDDLQYTFTGNPLPVPIGDIGTFTSTLVVNSPFTEIMDINVLRLNITHTWTADLVVVLRSPDDTEVQLLQGLCGDQDDILLNFDDAAAAEYGQIPCPATDNGWYKPQSPLAAFNGENPNGIWTLIVTDVEAPDGGALNDWAIDFPVPTTALYADTDGDGYGDPALEVPSPCSLPGYVANNQDCDDTDGDVYPCAEEVCNGKDDDCDGTIDNGVANGNSTWSNSDIGSANGSASYDLCASEAGDVFTINANGFSTPSSDVLHAVYRQLCGNGEIIARVVSVNGGGWAGIMMRETLSPGSKKATLKTQLSSLIRREIRTVNNGVVSSLQYNRPQHIWLRITRSGSTLTGYTATNGVNWSFAFSASISMAPCIYVGLFSESINTNTVTTAVFDNVFTTTPPVLPLTGEAGTALFVTPPTPGLEVYPNPATDEVAISLTGYEGRAVRIEVYDAQGQMLEVMEIDAAVSSSTQPFNFSAYPNGIYLFRVSSKGLPDAAKRVIRQGASRQ
jgi:subtilisin-like proprotein convertase family protein